MKNIHTYETCDGSVQKRGVPETNGKRLYAFDIAKGILILCLLFSHFGVACGNAGIDICQEHFAWIYGFLPLLTKSYMQCFFFISGYCSNFDVDARTFLRKQLKGLVLPAVIFGSLLGLYNHFVFQWNLTIVTFWFLHALLFAKIICYFLYKYVSDYRINLLLTALLLLVAIAVNRYDIGSNVLSVNQCLASCFFVMLGLVMKNLGGAKSVLLKYSWMVYVVFFLIVYVLHIQFSLPSITGIFNKYELSMFPLLVFIPFVSIFTLLRFCQMLGRCRWLEYLGRNSLVVYCLHMIPLVWLIKLTFQWFRPENRFQGSLFMLFIIAIEVLVMFAVISFFNKKPLKYVLGKF